MKQPLVSICCSCYNHEQYIQQALDSFLMQKTDFQFEVIISDDCSLDSTRRIIAQYTEQYPELIRDVSTDTNKGSIENWWYILKQARSKYVAICEGDDYWTDPYKLQKQVDFLEEHPEFVICAHNAYQHFSDNTWRLFVNPNHREHEISLSEILHGWNIPTASIIYRKEILDKTPFSESHPNGDYHLMLRLLSQGKFYYNPSVMSVYRMHDNSISAKMNRNKVKMFDDIINLLNHVRLLFNDKNQPIFDEAISNYELAKFNIIRSSDPLRKWFSKKTYTRAIKKMARTIFNL